MWKLREHTRVNDSFPGRTHTKWRQQFVVSNHRIIIYFCLKPIVSSCRLYHGAGYMLIYFSKMTFLLLCGLYAVRVIVQKIRYTVEWKKYVQDTVVWHNTVLTDWNNTVVLLYIIIVQCRVANLLNQELSWPTLFSRSLLLLLMVQSELSTFLFFYMYCTVTH